MGGNPAILLEQGRYAELLSVLGHAAAEDMESIVGQPRHRKIADQFSPIVQHRRQHDPARLRHAIGQHARQERLRARAGKLVFRISRRFDQPDGRAHGAPDSKGGLE